MFTKKVKNKECKIFKCEIIRLQSILKPTFKQHSPHRVPSREKVIS